jgi:muconolactone delta-isomerase
MNRVVAPARRAGKLVLRGQLKHIWRLVV